MFTLIQVGKSGVTILPKPTDGEGKQSYKCQIDGQMSRGNDPADAYRPAAEVATDFGVSIRTARKWMSRYRHGGECLSHVSVAEDAYDNSAFAAAACCAPYASLLAPGLPPWRRNCLLSAINGKCRDKCCIWISSGLERLMGLGTEK